LALADDKPNPTGTWKYTAERDGQSFEVTIKLKLEGDKLTGTVTVADMESKIEDAKYKDGKASFTVNRENNGNKIVIKYDGTIKGDTFKGKRDLELNGEKNTREFEAKRVKE
jgi:hypothetical protein